MDSPLCRGVDGWMDYSCRGVDGWMDSSCRGMDGWMDSPSFRGVDGWMDSSSCRGVDGWMDSPHVPHAPTTLSPMLCTLQNPTTTSTTNCHTHTHTCPPPPPAAIGLTSDDFRNILITSVGELPALFVALAGMELLGRRTTITLALGSTALATLALTTHPTGATFSALMFAGRWGGGWAARGGGLQPYYVVWTYCLHA